MAPAKFSFGAEAGTRSREAQERPGFGTWACATAGSFQRANTAFGAGFNPLNLKWNFATRGRIEPYSELSGGTLFTNHTVPAGTNTINFTPSAALGTHFLGASRNLAVELRYMHISNAGLERRNPGINTLQIRLGFGEFFSRHSRSRKP
jgi:hypothetical protein